MKASEYAQGYEQHDPTAPALEVVQSAYQVFTQAQREGVEVTIDNLGELSQRYVLIKRQRQEQLEGLMESYQEITERMSEGDIDPIENNELSMKALRMAIALISRNLED